MTLPKLLPDQPAGVPAPAPTDSVLFVIYAPYGDDPVLSGFPDGSTRTLAQHPTYQGALQVAAQGVHVVALIDLANDDTWLVEVEAFLPAKVRVTSRWKQMMNSPRNLAGLLRYAHQSRPTAAIVLALEGHGAGFLPELDPAQLSTRNVTDNGKIIWQVDSAHGSRPVAGDGYPGLPTGSPLLPTGSPLLPTGSPLLPSNHMPLSTWGLGAALKSAEAAGVPKIQVIHFDNCFNMSVEVMHTIAPYAVYATGYANYNFFTAGAPYPGVFERLRLAGAATPQQLAQWFAEGNHKILAAKGNHPTIGSVVRLARMQGIAERIDDLSDALLAALRGAAGPGARQTVVNNIRSAIITAQQYDTEAGFMLETPDELTDIYSFATALLGFNFMPAPVAPAAAALQSALKGIKAYGDTDQPWVAQGSGVTWDFSRPELAMNILLPDPLLKGLWDWRAPFYLDVNPDPTRPLVQPHIIDFVKVTDWVDFIIEYHKETPFVGLLPAAIPEFPVFNAKFDPKRPGNTVPGGPGNPGVPGQTPGSTVPPTDPNGGLPPKLGAR